MTVWMSSKTVADDRGPLVPLVSRPAPGPGRGRADADRVGPGPGDRGVPGRSRGQLPDGQPAWRGRTGAVAHPDRVRPGTGPGRGPCTRSLCPHNDRTP